MCASNSPCRSPPRSGPTTESQADRARFHQPHPPHPAHPYIYYPPPYPPLNPYGPYAPYPGAYYPPPYCNDAAQEPKGGPSWFSIILIGLLILCVVSIVCYRALSRDTRRRLHARLSNVMQPAQVNLDSGCRVITSRDEDVKSSYRLEN